MIHTEQPENFNHDLEVVACLVEHEGKFILLHRQDNKIHGGRWGQPAGKVDLSDNSKIDAMIRELREETGIQAQKEDLSFYKTFFVSHQDRDFLYHYFIMHVKEKPDIVLSEKEHKGFSWVTLEESLEMPLVMDEDFCLKDYFGIK